MLFADIFADIGGFLCFAMVFGTVGAFVYSMAKVGQQMAEAAKTTVDTTINVLTGETAVKVTEAVVEAGKEAALDYCKERLKGG